MKNELRNFFAVDSTGYSYVTTIAFNPLTLEVKSGVTYDYDDARNENEAFKRLHRNEKVTKLYKHFKGMIQVGDLVQINRGRKFKGETKRVVKEFTYQIDGMYGRSYGDVEYLVFEDGTKVAKHNCDLVKDYETLFESLFNHTRQYILDKINSESVGE